MLLSRNPIPFSVFGPARGLVTSLLGKIESLGLCTWAESGDEESVGLMVCNRSASLPGTGDTNVSGQTHRGQEKRLWNGLDSNKARNQETGGT